MRIKVDVKFLDAAALEAELKAQCRAKAASPALCAVYCKQAEALVDLMKKRSYAVFDFNFENKKAQLVGVYER